MGFELPPEVRQQLTGMGLSFRVALAAKEGGSKLDGTWSSQHVTYSAMDLAVKRVHDPFDVKLTLTRAGEKTELGGRFPEDGP